jgi:hypothetical protein
MSDLRGSGAPKEFRFGSAGKIVGAVVVICAVGAAGAYIYKSMPPPAAKQHVTNDELPTTAPPSQQ